MWRVQKNQFCYAVPRKLRMPAASNILPAAAFTAAYTQTRRLMSGQAGADGLAAELAALHRSGKFIREPIPYWQQARKRAQAFAVQ